MGAPDRGFMPVILQGLYGVLTEKHWETGLGSRAALLNVKGLEMDNDAAIEKP